MLSDRQTKTALGSIRVTQLIAGAIFIGAIVFIGIMAAVMVDWDELGGPIKLMSTLAAASTIIFLGLAIVLPSMFPVLPEKIKPTKDSEVQNRAIREIGKLLTSKLIVRLFLLEACVFANLLPLMFEPRWINIVAIAVALLMMLFFFPIRQRQLAKIDNHFTDWQAGAHG